MTNTMPSVHGVDTGQLESFLNGINQQTTGYLPPLRLADFLALLHHGGSAFTPGAILNGIGRYAWGEILVDMRVLAQLVILAVVCAVLENLQGAFEREAVGKLAYTVGFLALVALAFGSFSMAMQGAKGSLEQLVNFMEALVPLLLTLLAGTGAFTTAGLFQPILVVTVNGVSVLVADVVLPLLFLAAVVEVVGGISTTWRLSYLSSLLRQGSVFALGLLFSVFLGVIAIEGVVAPVADGVALRTGKFLASSFIPVVGKMFADATELILGSSLLLKSAVGLVGAIGILFMMVFPLLKLISLVLSYRVAAAVIQPIGVTQVVEALNSMANSLTLVLVSLGLVTLMFFLAITIVLGAGNAAIIGGGA